MLSLHGTADRISAVPHLLDSLTRLLSALAAGGTRGTHDKVRDTLALYNMESVRLLSAPLGPSHAAIPSSIPSQHSTVTQSHTNARSTPIQVSTSLRLPAHSSSFIHFLPRASLVASPAVSLNSLPPARGRSVVNNRGWRRARTRARYTSAARARSCPSNLSPCSPVCAYARNPQSTNPPRRSSPLLTHTLTSSPLP